MHAMLIDMAGYDFVSYVDAHALDSDAPSEFIEEALVRAKLKKKEET